MASPLVKSGIVVGFPFPAAKAGPGVAIATARAMEISATFMRINF
jgi:hypothetical protein